MSMSYGSIDKLSRVLFSLVFLLCILGLSQSAHAENKLWLTSAAGRPGANVTIEAHVTLDQDLQVMGWTISFDPNSLTLEKCEVLYNTDAAPIVDEVSTAADGTHKVVYQDFVDLVALSATATDRPLIRYTFKIAGNVQVGTNLPIAISWTSGNKPMDIYGTEVTPFDLAGGKIEVRLIPLDVDNNGEYNKLDRLYLLRGLFSVSPVVPTTPVDYTNKLPPGETNETVKARIEKLEGK